ncbi:MAG: GAK system ATP-grasp enzyme [Desulfobacteraceae bacterium]
MKQKRIGVVGTRDGWSSEALVESAENRTGYGLLIEMDKVRLDCFSKKAFYEGVDLTELDALVIKKTGAGYSPHLLDRLEMLRALNENGLKMFSAPLKIIQVLNRLSCTVSLLNHGIPMPETVITEDVDEAVNALKHLKRCVLKPIYTSKARGMELVNSDDPEAFKKIRDFRDRFKLIYLQKRVHLPEDLDLGVVFMGGEYLGTYARKITNGSWNTTTESGGRYEPYEPEKEIIELAGKARDVFGLDLTTVDVALTEQGPVVFEVSAFGGFKGIQTVTGMNVSDRYIDYVLERLY